MKDPLDDDRTAEMFDPIVPGETGATAESEDEKRRRKWRERKRGQRAAEKAQEVAQTTENESEWRAGNRALLSKEELAAMLEQHDRIRNILDEITLIGDPEFPEFTIERVTVHVVDSVKAHGVTHLGAITRSDDIPPDWASGVWRNNAKYWQDPALLALLEAEGPQTAQYVRYGLLAALPDWKVVEFLKEKAGWPWQQAADLVGYHT